jgi:hypothetical protein
MAVGAPGAATEPRNARPPSCDGIQLACNTYGTTRQRRRGARCGKTRRDVAVQTLPPPQRRISVGMHGHPAV